MHSASKVSTIPEDSIQYDNMLNLKVILSLTIHQKGIEVLIILAALHYSGAPPRDLQCILRVAQKLILQRNRRVVLNFLQDAHKVGDNVSIHEGCYTKMISKLSSILGIVGKHRTCFFSTE